MSWLHEAQRAVTGCWRLFLRDTDGFDEFDLTERGFWLSFTAIIPIAPVYVYAATVKIPVDPIVDTPQDEPSMVLSAVGLVVQWIAWPLVMAFVARLIGLAHYYSRYIIAYNWSSILVMAAQLVPVLLIAQGGSTVETGQLLFAAILAVVLYYRWYIAFTALETGAAIASALVLGDLVLSFAITQLVV